MTAAGCCHGFYDKDVFASDLWRLTVGIPSTSIMADLKCTYLNEIFSSTWGIGCSACKTRIRRLIRSSCSAVIFQRAAGRPFSVDALQGVQASPTMVRVAIPTELRDANQTIAGKICRVRPP